MADLEALLGPGGRYEGNLTVAGDVRLEGAWKGRLKTPGLVEIAATGHIDGELDAGTLILAGRADGSIRVQGELRLLASARLTGEVRAGALAAEPGCEVDAWIVVRKG